MHLLVALALSAEGAVGQLASLVGHEVTTLGKHQILQVQHLPGSQRLETATGKGQGLENNPLLPFSPWDQRKSNRIQRASASLAHQGLILGISLPTPLQVLFLHLLRMLVRRARNRRLQRVLPLLLGPDPWSPSQYPSGTDEHAPGESVPPARRDENSAPGKSCRASSAECQALLSGTASHPARPRNQSGPAPRFLSSVGIHVTGANNFWQ